MNRILLFIAIFVFAMGVSTTNAQTFASSDSVYFSLETLDASRYEFKSELDWMAGGREVFELQKRLMTEGYFKSHPTGDYGLLTENAVKSYQANHNLPVTGIVDARTIVSLNASAERGLALKRAEDAKQINLVKLQLASVITQLINLLQTQIDSSR